MSKEVIETQDVAATAEKTKGKNVVVMKDGRTVDFGVRGKLKKAVEIVGSGADAVVKIAVDCINGDTHHFEFNAQHPLLLTLAAHGASQKITDSITKAEENDDVSLGVAQQIQQLIEGKWSQRPASEGLAKGFSTLLEALRRLKEAKEPGQFLVGSERHEALKKGLLSKTEDQLKEFRANPTIKALMAEIESEKAAARAAKLKGAQPAEVSTDDLLADL